MTAADAPHSAPATRRARRTFRGFRLGGDVGGGLLLGALAAGMLVYLFAGGAIGGTDSLVAFYPMYGLLGERVWAGELPLWNPHLFSGVPLAADPQSGWLYAPVMLAFGAFPIAVASVLLTAAHLVLAGAGAFLLARALGAGSLGASVAGVAYLGNGWFAQRLGCCPVDAAFVAWLPWPILGAELALRPRSWPTRLAWWGVAAFALSQAVNAWLGQGAYYTTLAFGCFLVYRTLVDPPRPASPRERVAALGLHGAAIGLLAAGLAAGALLPRLEYLRQSTLADGYPTRSGGAGWAGTAEAVLGETTTTLGNLTLAVAVAGAILLGRRGAAPCWTALAAAAFVFSTDARTPLHTLAYAVLPRFEDLQSQLPSRILPVGYLAAALLAGAFVGRIREIRPGRRTWAAAGACGALVTLAAVSAGAGSAITAWSVASLAAGATLVALVTAPSGITGRVRAALPLVILAALLADLGTLWYDRNEWRLADGVVERVDLGTYYGAPPAARFLLDEEGGAPFRFAGMDPTLDRPGRGGVQLYGRFFGLGQTARIVVNNRAALLGLDDAQGVNNPVHLTRYDEFIAALNGGGQDYHNASLLTWEALESPLLDLLNVRYVVVPNARPPARPDLQELYPRYPTVFENNTVRVLENPGVLPRAWIVHEARQVAPGEALPLLASGAVAGRTTALLEAPPPPLAPGDPAADRATVVDLAPESITVETETDAPGLLVLSQPAYPAWRASVDGERVETFVADHTLLAVPIPAGRHTVEVRFESRPFRVGFAVTVATAAGVTAVWGWAGVGVLWAPSARRRWAPSGGRRARRRTR